MKRNIEKDATQCVAVNGYPRVGGSHPNDTVSETAREQQNAQSQIDTIHDSSRETKIQKDAITRKTTVSL